MHESLYDRFVEGFVELTQRYVPNDPTRKETTLGPVAKKSGADLVRAHIAQALERGAKALVDPKAFPRHDDDGL